MPEDDKKSTSLRTLFLTAFVTAAATAAVTAAVTVGQDAVKWIGREVASFTHCDKPILNFLNNLETQDLSAMNDSQLDAHRSRTKRLIAKAGECPPIVAVDKEALGLHLSRVDGNRAAREVMRDISATTRKAPASFAEADAEVVEAFIAQANPVLARASDTVFLRDYDKENLLSDLTERLIAAQTRRLVLAKQAEVASTARRGPRTGGDPAAAPSAEASPVAATAPKSSGAVAASRLKAAVDAAESVGRVIQMDEASQIIGHAAGFLIGPNLVMTVDYAVSENGVFSTPALDAAGRGVSLDRRLTPDTCLLSDHKIGYAIIGVEAPATGTVPSALRVADSAGPELGAALTMMYFPKVGAELAVALDAATVTAFVDDFVHYAPYQTMLGSGGAPVLDETGAVVAVHRAKVPAQNQQGKILKRDGSIWSGGDDYGEIKWIAGEGYLVARALADARAKLQAGEVDCPELEWSPIAPSSPTPRWPRTGLYYVAADDPADAFYADLGGQVSAAALHDLVTRKHTVALSYRAARFLHLYPNVDLRPDGELYGIYSNRRLTSVDAQGSKPFNTEQVVPQSWFDKKPPMKGDLHNLFVSDPACNSFKSNLRFRVIGTDEGAIPRAECGRRVVREPPRLCCFEPTNGRGPAARAVLYFIIRYPEFADQFDAGDVAITQKWNREDPPGLWERRRNREIQKAQGNRNPFIDRPEWADEINFSAWLANASG